MWYCYWGSPPSCLIKILKKRWWASLICIQWYFLKRLFTEMFSTMLQYSLSGLYTRVVHNDQTWVRSNWDLEYQNNLHGLPRFLISMNALPDNLSCVCKILAHNNSPFSKVFHTRTSCFYLRLMMKAWKIIGFSMKNSFQSGSEQTSSESILF